MTVQDTGITQVTGTGSLATYGFTFRILQAADLVVTVTDTSGNITTLAPGGVGYTLNTAPGLSSGTITLAAGNLTAGYLLTMARQPAATQPSSYQELQPFPSAQFENNIDDLTMQVQALKLQPALRTPIGDPLGLNLVLPSAAERALLYAGFDAGGNLVAGSPGAGTIIPAGSIVQQIASVAALRTYATPVNGYLVQTQGYATPNDGGQGLYIWNSTDTRTDNGGTVIKITAITTGRWNLVPIDGIVGVWNWGAVGTSTDDSTAINAALTALAAGTIGSLHFDGSKTYTIANRLALNAATYFTIHGNGCQIFASNSMPNAAGYQMLYLTNCTDGTIRDLYFNANRAGRPYNATPQVTESVYIFNGNARLNFVRVRSDNAPCDGFYLDSATPTVLNSIPTDIHFDHCTASNAFRNNMSIICSNRFRDYSGIYLGANGAAPQAGIDVEPNSSGDQGNLDCRFYGTECSNNSGAGFQVTISNTHVKMFNCTATNNTLAAIEGSWGTLYVDGFYAETYGATVTRGVIDCSSGSGRTELRNVMMKDILTASAGLPCIYIHSSNTGPVTIENLDIYNVSCPGITGFAPFTLDGMNVDVVVAAMDCVQAEANNCIIRNLTANLTTSYATRAVYASGVEVLVDGVYVKNPGITTNGALLFDTGCLATVKNVTVYHDTAIPSGQTALYFNSAPRLVDNISAFCAGTDYTAATVATFSGGTAGSIIGTIRPYPFEAQATISPPLLASGSSQIIGTISVLGAAFGDFVQVSASYDLQGCLVTGYVSSANNVKIAQANLTGGNITLGASGTWKVKAIKP
jgi:hypothetical protein